MKTSKMFMAIAAIVAMARAITTKILSINPIILKLQKRMRHSLSVFLTLRAYVPYLTVLPTREQV